MPYALCLMPYELYLLRSFRLLRTLRIGKLVCLMPYAPCRMLYELYLLRSFRLMRVLRASANWCAVCRMPYAVCRMPKVLTIAVSVHARLAHRHKW